MKRLITITLTGVQASYLERLLWNVSDGATNKKHYHVYESARKRISAAIKEANQNG